MPAARSSSPQQDKGSRINDGNGIKLSYGPYYCGMSKEEHEWRRSQARERVAEVLHKVHAESEKVRRHFSDDPVALQIWDQYMDDIDLAASRNLTYSLSIYAQKSALYEKLMRSKVRSNTGVHMLSGGYGIAMLSSGYDKLKRIAKNKIVPVAGIVSVVGVAAGAAVGSRWKDKETKLN